MPTPDFEIAREMPHTEADNERRLSALTRIASEYRKLQASAHRLLLDGWYLLPKTRVLLREKKVFATVDSLDDGFRGVFGNTSGLHQFVWGSPVMAAAAIQPEATLPLENFSESFAGYLKDISSKGIYWLSEAELSVTVQNALTINDTTKLP